MKLWQTTNTATVPEAYFRTGLWRWRRYFAVSPWQRYYEHYRNIRSTIQLNRINDYRNRCSLPVDGDLKMDRALVLGNFEAKDGLSRGAHYTLPSVRKRHEDVTVHHVSVHGSGHKTIEGSLAGAFSHVYLLDPPSRYSRLLTQVTPEQIKFASRTGLWVRETNYVPGFWTSAAAFLDEVWAPSEFAAKLIGGSTAGRPVVVVPHAAVVTCERSTVSGQWANIQSRPFKGLAIMDLRGGGSRKNPWAVIAAWKLAFAGNPECQLLMKVRISASRKIVREELELLIGNDTNITLLDAFLPDDELNALMDEADVFVSLHRSEGYGLPVEEALLRGTPVVATDWSATVEFAKKFSNYHPVSYQLVPARYWDKHIPRLNFHWAEADLASAAGHLKAVYANWSSRAKASGPTSRKTSADNVSETVSKA